MSTNVQIKFYLLFFNENNILFLPKAMLAFRDYIQIYNYFIPSEEFTVLFVLPKQIYNII